QTYNYVQLNKGSNTIKISCEQGNQCDALLDQLWLVNGWVDS
ncbi:MAG: carbohydrate-binding protein, partial [Streptomyces sp.]|nr:carbohydrate-binding protein [Streptomyces sp.]NUS78290.1 carbohydrate-binding protein [Streptomyces sp.]